MQIAQPAENSATRQYRWQLLDADKNRVAAVARALGVSSITALILTQRTGGELDDVNRFLRPRLTDLHPPSSMKDLPRAAERLAHAIREKEHIIIYGDYDADGITATAILLTVLRVLGANVDYYLPSRMEEGYGISDIFVEKALAEKTIDLIVTVDCGTSETEKVARLMHAGITVIITDHHEPGGKDLPAAYAVLNPKRSDATYPFRDLVGAGVAFKLAWGLCEVIAGSNKVGDELQETLLRALSLAAIGTIADVAPIVDENRIIVKHGLSRFTDVSAGLRALLEIAKVNIENPSCRDVSFAVAPRINAAGRLDAADLALNVLLAEEVEVARELAKKLNNANEERKNLCTATMKIAHEILQQDEIQENRGALVLAAQQLHKGIIGIVAGRLAEDYNLPCAVISLDQDGNGHGSARGVAGFNLYAAMKSAEKLLGNFGGHEQAVGFGILRENIAAFREHFTRYCREHAATNTPTLSIDCEVTLAEIHDGLACELGMITQLCDNNNYPKFLCRRVRITGEPRIIGEGSKRYFTLNAVQNNVGYHAQVRNMSLLTRLDKNRRRFWDIVFTLNRNAYFATPRLELHIIDMQLCD